MFLLTDSYNRTFYDKNSKTKTYNLSQTKIENKELNNKNEKTTNRTKKK